MKNGSNNSDFDIEKIYCFLVHTTCFLRNLTIWVEHFLGDWFLSRLDKHDCRLVSFRLA